MARYRLYFKALGSIVGRQDFGAEDDAAAQRIAAVLFDACSDRSQNIELWQEERLLSLDLPGRGAGLDSLCEAYQARRSPSSAALGPAAPRERLAWPPWRPARARPCRGRQPPSP